MGCKPVWTHSRASTTTAGVSATKTTPLLSIEITTHLGDQQTFIEGDEIQFLVSLNRDAYLTAIFQDAGGNLWQVYPNQYTPSGKLAAGEYLSLPQNTENYRFVTTAPFGTETLYAFASMKPLAPLDYNKTINGLRQLRHNLKQINALFENHSKKQHSTFASATLSIQTRGK